MNAQIRKLLFGQFIQKTLLHLKFIELLFGAGRLCHFQHIKANRFAKRSAFTDGNNVAESHISAK